MHVTHPLEWVNPAYRGRPFLATVALTFILMVALNGLNGPLKTQAAPAGIISYELAGDLARAEGMVDSWGESGRVYAGLSLGLDYLYLVTYPAAIGLGCLLVARRLEKTGSQMPQLGGYMAWAVLAAGLLDAVENYALARVLLGTDWEGWPILAQFCASVKFLAIGLALLYVLAGGILALIRKQSARARPGSGSST